MIIAVDLDGVVFNTESAFNASGELFDIKISGGGIVDPNEIRLQKKYGWGEEKYNQWMDEEFYEIMEEAELIPYSKQIISKLKAEGHKIIFATNRGIFSDREKQITMKRLKETEIEYDEIVFNAGNKLDVCKNYNVDLIIDDYYPNVKFLCENGVKCLYFRDVYQKDIDSENLVNVKNWGEVYRVIYNLTHK